MNFLTAFQKLNQDISAQTREGVETVFGRIAETKAAIEAALSDIKKNKRNKTKILGELALKLDTLSELQRVPQMADAGSKGAVPKATGRITRASSRRAVTGVHEQIGTDKIVREKRAVGRPAKRARSPNGTPQKSTKRVKNKATEKTRPSPKKGRAKAKKKPVVKVEEIVLDKRLVVKIEPLSDEILLQLSNGGKVIYDGETVTCPERNNEVNFTEEDNELSDRITNSQPVEESCALTLDENRTIVVKEEPIEEVVRLNSTVKNKTLKSNITHTPVQRTTRTKKRNLAKGIFETVFESPAKDNEAEEYAFMPDAVSTVKTKRVLPKRQALKNCTNMMSRLELTTVEEDEAQLEKERERMLLEKQKEDAEKRRLLAKAKSDKMKKARLEEERTKNEKATTEPIYKTHTAPQLPTYDCYDSDDPERLKVDYASLQPEWTKAAAFSRSLHTMLMIDSDLKNTFFSRAPVTPDLQEIFENIDPNKLRRNSSAIWLSQSKLQLTLHDTEKTVEY